MKQVRTILKELIIIQFFLALAFQSGLFSQPLQEKLDNLMQEYNKNEIFNGVVLIADSTGIVLEKGYGLANFDKNIDNTPQTQFRIGSLTKQFVATVILQLASEGKLSLDDKISKYLTEYRKDIGEKVTIHQLLNHTSGIRSYTNIPHWWKDSSKIEFSKEHLITISHSSNLDFEPGSNYSYNNTGYYLLGIIAERASGIPYELLLRQRIFDPVNMNSTGIERDKNPPPNLAQGYMRKGANFVKDDFFYMANLLGAGDVYSTAGDLYKWDQALYTNDYISESLKELMWTPSKNDYGYGWKVSVIEKPGDDDSTTKIWHTGSVNGFNSVFVRHVDQKQTIILLHNTGPTSLMKIADNIWYVLNGYESLKVKKSFIPELERILLEKEYDKAVEYFKENEDSIKAEYELDENAINLRGKQVLNEELNTDKALAIFEINAEAFPESYTVYESLADALYKDGKVQEAINYYKKSLAINPANTEAQEMIKKIGVDTETHQDIKLTNEDLKKYAGSYRLSDDFYVEISVFEDRIYEQATDQQRYEIFPKTKTDFYTKVSGTSIRFYIDEAGNVKGLTLFQDNKSMTGEKID